MQSNIAYCTLRLDSVANTKVTVTAIGFIVQPDNSVLVVPSSGTAWNFGFAVDMDYNMSLEAVKDSVASQIHDYLSTQFGITNPVKVVVLPLL